MNNNHKNSKHKNKMRIKEEEQQTNNSGQDIDSIVIVKRKHTKVSKKKNSSGPDKLYFSCNCLKSPVSDLKSGIPAEVLIPAPTIKMIFLYFPEEKSFTSLLYFISYISSGVKNLGHIGNLSIID